MRFARRCRFQRGLDNSAHFSCRQFGFAARSGRVLLNAGHSFLGEPVSPQLDRGAGNPEFCRNVFVLSALCSEQDNTGSFGDPHSHTTTSGCSLKHLLFACS